MGKLDYETAKKIKEMLESKTYDEIEAELGVSSKTIAKVKKMSDEEIEELKAVEKEEKAEIGEESLKAKAKKQFFKEIRDRVADESLERLRELIKLGAIVEELYQEKREQAFLNAVQMARNEEIKNYLIKLFVFHYLKGHIDKTELAKKILAISYA